LLKTTNIRGTVHTSVPQHFGWLDAVARAGRAGMLRNYLRLDRLTPDDVGAEIEAYAANQWRERADIVAHIRSWLAERESADSAAALADALPENLVWGHSGLLRRPRDERWEKRTDIYHRRARSLLPDIAEYDLAAALTELVRVYLGAYGPATREDLAYFLGTRLGLVDAAVRDLGDQIVRLPGPDRDDYLDLAEPLASGRADPGLRLLPEYDGLLVGYHGRNRTRFLTEQQLPRVWAKVNGLFAPIVLCDGLIVASWRTLTKGSRTDIEVRMLDPHPALATDLFTEAVATTQRVLDLTVTDIRVLPPP
jgi:Winged helix DNA-binding domain